MQFAIATIPPQGNHYALAEMEQTVYFGLKALGYDCIILNPIELYNCHQTQHEKDQQYIILGCHSNPFYENPFPIPANSILYNFEQIDTDSPWLRAGYIDYLCQYPIWDYSLINIAKLKQLGIDHVAHVPVGYTPEMTRITSKDIKDIDVLFYGSINDRRQQILDDLTAKGINVKTLFGIYGQQRDDYIARAKIILNIHFYEAKVFEIVRVSYLLANRAFVISEQGAHPEEEATFADGVVFTTYENLVHCCLEYLKQDAKRQTIADRGFQRIQGCCAKDYLQQGIQTIPQIRQTANPSGIFIRDFYRKCLAKNAFDQGNYQQSIAMYEQTIEVDPHCLESYWNLGLVLRCLGEEIMADMVWATALEGTNLEKESPNSERDRLSNLLYFLHTERQRQMDFHLSDHRRQILNAIQESLKAIERNLFNR